jgi:hypothetical protein
MTIQGWQAAAVAAAMLAGFSGTAQTLAAASPEKNPEITIHVYNFAGVDRETLAEAEKVASGIYRQAGVETRWADAQPDMEQENSADPDRVYLADIRLNIVPREVSDSFHLSKSVMGLAPGGGRDRVRVFVFYSRIQQMVKMQGGGDRMDATMSQILGAVISHEIGHILLNMDGHSEAGIMRGNWDYQDIQNVSCASLLFIRQQARVIRDEVSRRRDICEKVAQR